MKKKSEKENCIDCNEFDKQNKLEQKRIISLKPKFEKARSNSYEELLRLWDESGFHHHSGGFAESNGTLIISPKPDENNRNEIEVYNKWYQEHFFKRYPEFTFSYFKKDFDSRLENSPLKEKFITNELKALRDKMKLYKERNCFVGTSQGYEDAIQGKVIDYSVYQNSMMQFCYYLSGFDHAKFEGYMITQLKEIDVRQTKPQTKKLKWNCSPSVLGFLITELASKGFIEYPLRGGESNYAGLAKICFEIFECSTTQENLIKEFNPNKNTLSETKRNKFTIAELSDIK